MGPKYDSECDGMLSTFSGLAQSISAFNTTSNTTMSRRLEDIDESIQDDLMIKLLGVVGTAMNALETTLGSVNTESLNLNFDNFLDEIVTLIQDLTEKKSSISNPCAKLSTHDHISTHAHIKPTINYAFRSAIHIKPTSTHAHISTHSYDIFTNNTCANNLSSQDLFTDNFSAHNIRASDVCTHDHSANNFSANNFSAQNICANNLSSHNYICYDLSANNFSACNICPHDLSSQAKCYALYKVTSPYI